MQKIASCLRAIADMPDAHWSIDAGGGKLGAMRGRCAGESPAADGDMLYHVASYRAHQYIVACKR